MSDPELALRALVDVLDGTPSPCQTSDPEVWFDKEQRDLAIELCGTCHAMDECLTYAETIQAQHGIWAGVLFDQGVRRAG